MLCAAPSWAATAINVEDPASGLKAKVTSRGYLQVYAEVRPSTDSAPIPTYLTQAPTVYVSNFPSLSVSIPTTSISLNLGLSTTTLTVYVVNHTSAAQQGGWSVSVISTPTVKTSTASGSSVFTEPIRTAGKSYAAVGGSTVTTTTINFPGNGTTFSLKATGGDVTFSGSWMSGPAVTLQNGQAVGEDFIVPLAANSTLTITNSSGATVQYYLGGLQ